MSTTAGSAKWWLRPLLRLCVIIVGLAVWFGTQNLLGERPPVNKIEDKVLDRLIAPNSYLNENRAAADALLIASSTVINILGVFLLGMSIFGPTVRPFMGLLLLFGMRQICQWLCALPAPLGIIWYDPGVPGLLVTYEVANDFFFSGHTGLAVLGAVEVVRFGGRRWLPIAVLIVVFEVITVLVLRAHYTMDVFTGAVVALYVATLSKRWAPWCDRQLARLWERPSSGAP
jgi:PAP2 superfamily C-terminal